MALIEFENVSFSYGDGKRALDDVSLAIEEGAFVCIIGGNGSGKSTLAKHMNALLVPSGGTVHVGGLATSQSGNTAKIRQMVGMVFQNPDDQIVASVVEDDVAFGPENIGLAPDEIERRVSDALSRVGMLGFRSHQTHALSSGQKQRVSIAGALAMRPHVLVLDEPGSTLDPIGRRAVMGICKDLNASGITIILITHFMEEAAQADRIIALGEGCIVMDATPREALVQTEIMESLSLEAPLPVKISEALQAQGLEMSTYIDEEELVDGIVSAIRSRKGL